LKLNVEVKIVKIILKAELYYVPHKGALGGYLFLSGDGHPPHRGIDNDWWKGKKVRRTGALLFG